MGEWSASRSGRAFLTELLAGGGSGSSSQQLSDYQFLKKEPGSEFGKSNFFT
jgi:hypothetical protein